VRVETLLPLGKLDPGLRASDTPLDLGRVIEDAQLVESLGYDGLAVEETKVDPYVVMALAAAGTTRLRLTTAVAMAFPRSPTVTAMSAWNIQKLSRGRFVLGLGSQVRGHITRRFGLPYRPPGPWMRDYVRAVRAVWTAWQQRTPLAFESPHYNLSLMVPLFDPGPIEHPDIPIHVAAVNSTMCRFVGEVADGLRPHPVCTPRYIRDVMLPAMRAGATAAGRSPALSVAMKPLVCAAPDEATLAARVRDVRARVAFYASTPGYRAALRGARPGRSGVRAGRAVARPALGGDAAAHQRRGAAHVRGGGGLWSDRAAARGALSGPRHRRGVQHPRRDPRRAGHPA